MISLFYFFIIVNNLDSTFAFMCKDRMTENLKSSECVYNIKRESKRKNDKTE